MNEMANREDIVVALQDVIDPELYIDVWTLGLIYAVDLEEGGVVNIEMTFTSMACPAGPQLVDAVKETVLKLPGITQVNVDVVFDPPWEPSEELKGMMGLM